MLPDLSTLTISNSCTKDDFKTWTDACGKGSPPRFIKWKKQSSEDKREFREAADRAENDKFSGGQYLSPYKLVDIDRMIKDRVYSIEHVLPRSKINGQAPGAAEDDPLGWVLATRSANSSRSNLPLVLWYTDDLQEGRVEINGVTHYNPPNRMKARLARKWFYIRACYGKIDDLTSPSAAQVKNRDGILANVKKTPVGAAERKMHSILIEKLGGWHNPLLEGNQYLEVAERLSFDCN